MDLFPEMLARQAVDRPERLAIVSGDERLSYGQLVEQVDRAAAALIEQGVRPGDSVALPGELTVDAVVAFLAAVRAGAVAVPLPAWVGDEARQGMVRDCGARVVVGAEGLAGSRAALPVVEIDELDPIDIVYSSGTTGTPKGVVHPHRMRAFQADRMGRLGIDVGAVVLLATPLCSNTTLVGLLPTLARGGTAALLTRFDEAGFLETAEREGATHTMLVPVQFRRLLDYPTVDRFELSAFETSFCTGAHLGAGFKRELIDRWPGRLVEIYGLTEGGCTCVLDTTAHRDRLDSVGRPADGVEIAVLGEDGARVAQGQVGEIAGRAISMMSGYHRRPEQTEAMTWRDEHGRRFVRTGDLGRIDHDGFVHLCGRKKDVIISGGINLFPEDIERVLLKLEAVSEAAVVAAPSERWGETPVAFVVLAPDVDASPDEITALANQRLSGVQRIDRVLLTERLPRNALGKVLREELRSRL